MKKLLYAFAAFSLLGLPACNDDELPEANFSRFQVESLSAVAGDGTVALAWISQEGKPAPLEYCVSWTAGSPDGTNGERMVEPSATQFTVEGLVNDCSYTFSVQPRYEAGLAMKVSATCTPKSTRIPVSNFKAMAGDKRVFLSWTAPETRLEYTCRIVVKNGGTEVKTVEVESSETSTLIVGLTNGTEYTFELTCVYGHGNSEMVSAMATPGEIDPITATATTLRQFELCTFEYNPAYFVQGEVASVKWNFGDGSSSQEMIATHCYVQTGSYTVTLTVTYEDGTTETASLGISVDGFAWTSVGGVGYQKASHIVFSHDGQTLYTVPQTGKKLIAINAITGEIAWQYTTVGATNGAGPVVGNDDTIYFGTEDAAGTLYAVTPRGTLKWKRDLGAAVKSCPAVTSDGMVYALIEGGKLFALNASDGTQKWTAQDASSTPGGVVVDANGDIYIGTYNGIWAYTPDGTLKWTCDTAYAVTERGGSLALFDGVLYATLRGQAGCAAISTSNGKTLWTYASKVGDCYHPVVDSEGTVYFSEKNGHLYAVTKTGTLKWSNETYTGGYIYTGFAIDADGTAYISQRAAPFALLAFDNAGAETTVLTIGAQTMSPVSIGPDRRLYYAVNETISAYNLGKELATEGWPVRGGNMQGTNSLK